MTILAKPGGFPNRVCSLVSVLHELGGDAPKPEVWAWLDPTRKAGESALESTLHAATSLGLVVESRSRLSLDSRLTTGPATVSGLRELVHGQMLADVGGNRYLLEAFSAVCLLAEDGYAGLQGNQKTIAARIKARLGNRGGMNQYQFSPWRRWMAFLGLGYMNLTKETPFLPRATVRLRTVLADVPPDELSAKAFRELIRERLPYLDGGATWEAVTGTANIRPAGRLSRILTASLRDLAATGGVSLEHGGTDFGGGGRILLAEDGEQPESFAILRLEAAAS